MFMVLPPAELCFCWLVRYTNMVGNTINLKSSLRLAENSTFKHYRGDVWRRYTQDVHVNSVCLANTQISIFEYLLQEA